MKAENYLRLGAFIIMAGWKLRKDKTQNETPGANPEEAEPVTAQHGAEIYSDPPHAPAPEFATGGDLHFEDEDGPLKLMDYSEVEPGAASPTQDVETPAADTPTDFTSTLRMNREELAAAFAPPPPAGIPAVPPFVLDAPLVAPATEDTPPRLVVRVGRLSAAFDLAKDVTVIGRPDSEMHFYPDVEIELDDAVSRRHAEVIKREDSYYLVDAGSTNGTLLNGEKLTPHEEHMLAHGDRIRVGERTEIIFE